MHPLTLPLRAAGTLSLAAQALPAAAEPPVPVAAIVKVPAPALAPRFLIVGRMRDTIPQYAAIAGLDYKIYTLTRADKQFGGVYLWQDRQAAEAWFNPAWFERVRKEREVEPEVRTLEVPVAIDNQVAGAPPPGADAVATYVSLPVPPGIDRARLLAEFNAAVPTYQKVPGLLRKYFTVGDDGRFGGIYLWVTAASAEAWFSPAWHERVRKTYGTDAVIEWFDAPIVLPTTLAQNRVSMVRP
jgi:heme-degrading monooxygenase HmoA